MPRRQLILAAAAAAVCILATSSTARAQWVANATGPDVFGNMKVIATAGNGSDDALVIQCGGTDPIALAYIMPATQDELNRLSKPGFSVPAELLVKVDSGSVEKFDAELRGWNSRFMAIAFTGRTPELASLIHAIGAAQHAINVGMEIVGNRQADAFGAFGSTSAMSTVIKDCAVDQIKPAASQDGTATQ